MKIKLIAVDMDGTFLNDRMEYDRARFQQQYRQLKQRGIKFVVASGNQYFQLISFFPEIADEIAFVAENGAYVVNQGETLFCAQMPQKHYQQILAVLKEIPFLDILVCTPESAYLERSARQDFMTDMRRFYHKLTIVDDFQALSGSPFKFALGLPDAELPQFMAFVEQTLAGMVVPVSSGHGSVDLVIPGMHKANGLQILRSLWGIASSEMAAFGDGGNDVEMLTQAGFGFAMANAPQRIKDIARFQAGNNNQSGVLNMIDDIINGVVPFN